MPKLQTVSYGNVHSQHTKYDISNYIYFNYNNWHTNSMDSGFGASAASLVNKTNQVLEVQKQNFAAQVGMSYEEFMQQLAKNANMLDAFHVLFTGGEETLKNNFTLEGLQQAKKNVADSISDLQNEVDFSVGGMDPEKLKNFFTSTGNLSADLYTLIQLMQNSEGVKAINSILSEGSLDFSVDPSAAILYEALSETCKELQSKTGLAQIGADDYDSQLADFFTGTLGSRIKEVPKNISMSIGKMQTILAKIQAGKKITTDEVKNAYSGLQRTLGTNSEILGTIEARFFKLYDTNKEQEVSRKEAAVVQRPFMNAISTGTINNKNGKVASISITYDGRPISPTGILNLGQIKNIDKTADTTITYENGTQIKISQKRYNPFNAQAINLTSRSLINLLAYLRDGDSNLSSFVNSEMFFNAMYFSYGNISWEQKIHKSGASRGEPYNRKRIVSKAMVDSGHGNIMTNFALRLYLDYFAVQHQAFFNINGEIIPAPLYAEMATNNVKATFGGAMFGNAAASSVSIFHSISFGGSYPLSGEKSGSTTLNKSLASLLKGDLVKGGNSNEIYEKATRRNQKAKDLILQDNITIKAPYITVDQYRAALGTGNL